MSVRDDVYFSFQDEAIRKTLGRLIEKTEVFPNIVDNQIKSKIDLIKL
jgi:hypothetical protein